MAVYQSKQVKAKVPVPTPENATDLIAITADYVTPTGGLASGAIVELFAIPPYCIPVDLKVHTGVLGTSVTLAAGLISGTYGDATSSRTQGAEFIAATPAATAVVLSTAVSTTAMLPTTAARGVGVKVGGATTEAAIAIRATLYVVPAPYGIDPA